MRTTHLSGGFVPANSEPLMTTVAALSGGDTVDAIREHFRPRRHEVERAITAHLLARGVPATGTVVIGPDELRGIQRDRAGVALMQRARWAVAPRVRKCS